MSSRFFSKHYLVSFIGNILDHYDTALCGFLAPFIAPLFFKEQDPVSSLLFTYGILFLGVLTKPLGSICFGWIGDRLGRRQALCLSLLGMGLTTVAIGFLPTYEKIGVLAPILLGFFRMGQNFFAAGETVGGAIFVLEHTEAKKRSFISSLYDASSISGILIASGAITFLSFTGWIHEGWRFLFFAGGVVAFIGLFLRLRTEESLEFIIAKRRAKKTFAELYKHRRALFAILFTYGLSYAVYSTAFTLMNGFVPLVTTLSKSDVMAVNTLLLVVDMALLPCFGLLAEKIGKENLMKGAAFFLLVSSLPLCLCLQGACFLSVILIRSIFVLLGVAFAAPYHAWALEQVPPEARYTVLSLGCALGAQLIGAPTTVLSLFAYKMTGWAAAPGLYLAFVAFGALYYFRGSKKIFSLGSSET